MALNQEQASYAGWRVLHFSFDSDRDDLRETIVKNLKEYYNLRKEKEEHDIDDSTPIYCIWISRSSYLICTPEKVKFVSKKIFKGITEKERNEHIKFFISKAFHESEENSKMHADDAITYCCWRDRILSTTS